MRHAIAPFLICALIVSCAPEGRGGASDSAGAAEAPACDTSEMTIPKAWARETRPGQLTGAVYLEICNGAPAPDRLIGTSFDGAAAAELHTMEIGEDGMVSMAPAHVWDIPAGGTLSMAPGGPHIMLIGLYRPISPHRQSELTVEFEKAGTLTVPLDVRSADDLNPQ